MGFLLRKAAVGLIALVTSIIPVVEIGIFGYETWSDQQTASDEHAAAESELIGFREDLELTALGNAQMPAGAERDDAVARWHAARGEYPDAREAWAFGDYDWMRSQILAGQAALAGEAPPVDDGGMVMGADLMGLEEGTSFPWLATIVAGTAALLAWGLYMGLPRSRIDPARPA